MDYRTRIEEIARRDGINIAYDARNILDSYSQVGIRHLSLAPWTGDPRRDHQQYWIALHEMGHVHTTDTRFNPEFLALFGPHQEILDTEAKAWEWAIRENGGTLDDVGKKVIDAAMGTYSADFGPGGDKTRWLAQQVTGSGAFSSHRRAEVESLLA